MRSKISWLITIKLTIIYIITAYFTTYEIDYKYHNQYNFYSDLPLWILNILIVIVAISLTGIIISSLFSLIPISSWKYIKKLKLLIPLGISLTFMVVIGIIIYNTYISTSGEYVKDSAPIIPYQSIIPLSNQNCLKIHNGKFEWEEFIIERRGDSQNMTEKETNSNFDFTIIWKSCCEYHVFPYDYSDTLKVKIISFHNRYYDCYETFSSSGPEFLAFRNRYKIIEFYSE